MVNLWLPWEIYRRVTCSVRREDMKPSVPTNRWGESGGNRKGIFLIEICSSRNQKPCTYFLPAFNLKKFNLNTWIFYKNTILEMCFSSLKHEKEKCIFCQTARSRYLSTILVAVVVRKTNTRRIAGEEGFWVKKENKGFNKGFPGKEWKQRFQQSVSQSSRLRQGTVSRSTLEVGSKVGAFPTAS